MTTDQIQNMRTAEALESLRWGFEAVRSTPLTATHGVRTVTLTGDGVLTVTDTYRSQPLAVSVPGMVCELDPAFVPPATLDELDRELDRAIEAYFESLTDEGKP